MSFEFGDRGIDARLSSLSLGDLSLALKSGALTAPAAAGRRGRKRKAKQRLSQAGLLAPILAAEGCLALGKDELPLAAADVAPPDVGNPAGGGGAIAPGGSGATDAQDDGNFHADTDAPLTIAVSDLLANDISPKPDSLHVVRVFDAQHGTVVLNGDTIVFTPDTGFEGMASFQYQIVDVTGKLSVATVEIHVGDAAGHHTEDSHQGHGGGDPDHPHADDPSKAGEHMAAMELAPVGEATHIAVNNGSWFDPSTWAGGEVPGEGAKVLIPEGVMVSYDGESSVSLFTVRVDGMLEFATDINTFMEVDTFLVAGTGHLKIGTEENPVQAGVETVIQFADNGPIDVAWDPMLLSRGLISHGTVDIHGAEKEAFLRAATDPMAGDTSITLEEAPDGWQVGDKLVLTGTHLTDVKEVAPGDMRDITTEDEELTITRIEGNVVYFDKPLEFDHDTPRADLKAYVANYSRNVRFETENADGVPVHQRGHVMFMHSDSIDVRYAEFHELGRTDKSERALDVSELTSVEADTNIKARYPLHIHRAGVDDITDPAMLVGNAVWGSPGWGFVHHDSNAILADNAAYDIFGAAFVAETGNETGRWAHNIAIKSLGVGGGPKFHEDVQAFDLGRTGAGFWFQGRLVDSVDNVAAGVPGGQGFVYMSRGNPGDVIAVLPENVPQSETLRYLDDALINKPAIGQFEGNESIATATGITVIKGGPQQEHDVRTVIEDFTAWEVRFGVHLQYTAHYTLKDIDVVGTDRSSGAGHAVSGIEIGPNTIDIVVNGAEIEGFENGVHLRKTIVNLGKPFNGDFEYVFIDVDINGATNNYVNRDSGDLFLTRADLVDGRLSFESDLAGFPQAPSNNNEPWLELSGTKLDSIGFAQVSTEWEPHLYNWYSLRGAVEQEGYWTLPDGRHITIFDQYISDRATGELIKAGIFVENLDTSNLNDHGGFTRVDPIYHGVLDIDSAAPVARTDFSTVAENGSTVINVLANDFDPDGDPLAIDGLVQPGHGRVYVNDAGSVTYVPDPNYTGDDEFWYWVEDDQGNFTKGHVQVVVDI